MRWFCLLPAGLLLASSAAFWARAATPDWTRFRGPNGAGVAQAASIPTTWTEKDYAWRVKLPGVGYSSPVIWNDRLYVTSTIEKESTLFVRCLKTSDGGVIWERKIKTKPHPPYKANCDASTTPAVDQDHVYVVWGTPDEHVVLALDQRTGADVWRRDLGPYIADDGFGASPILIGDMVIATNDQDPDGVSSVVALDRATGKTRWDIPRKTQKATFSTPCLFQPQGGKTQIILISCAQGITSLNPENGASNWELTDAFEIRTTGSPLIVADTLFATNGAGSGGKYLLAVRPGIPEKNVPPKILYRLTKNVPYVVTPVAKWPLVFLWCDNGIVACIDGPTGKLHWRQRVGGRYLGSPIRVGDRIYCNSCEGEMIVLAAADKFKSLARFSLGEASNSTPSVADGVMYLRTVSHVMALKKVMPQENAN